MEHQRKNTLLLKNRLGFHYFPDTLHFTEKDIALWLPILMKLGVKWLVLRSPITRAIPENFIRSFSSSRIELIIDFDYPLNFELDFSDLETLIAAYAKWGVNYAVLNRAPNCKKSWGEKKWINPRLVEDHIKQFNQFSQCCLGNGVFPVFSPLYPGGDYWDLAFLDKSLDILNKTASVKVRNNFILSAFAWHWGKSLNWGAGGANQWPQAKPYKTPEDSQNQIGFRNYERYTEIAFKKLGKIPSIILFESGLSNGDQKQIKQSEEPDLEKLRLIHRLMKDENVYDPENSDSLLNPISPQVIANNFYILSADDNSGEVYRWFSAAGEKSLPGQAVFMKNIIKKSKNESVTAFQDDISKSKSDFSFKRYILIAEPLNSQLDSFFRQLQPYLDKYQPLIGSSMEDASKSAYVIAIQPDGLMDPLQMDCLNKNGNLVKVIKPEQINTLMKERHEILNDIE